MNNADTPRTNAIPKRAAFHHYVVDDVLEECRKLERELTTTATALQSANDALVTARAERDEAVKALSRCPSCDGRGGVDSAEDSHECALCGGSGTSTPRQSLEHFIQRLRQEQGTNITLRADLAATHAEIAQMKEGGR